MINNVVKNAKTSTCHENWVLQIINNNNNNKGLLTTKFYTFLIHDRVKTYNIGIYN